MFTTGRLGAEAIAATGRLGAGEAAMAAVIAFAPTWASAALDRREVEVLRGPGAELGCDAAGWVTDDASPGRRTRRSSAVPDIVNRPAWCA